MTKLPLFVREALSLGSECEAGSDPASDLERAALVVGGSLRADVSVAPRRLEAVLARIQCDVAEVPVRYAPFYSRLATLLDRNEASIVTELERAKHERNFKLTPFSGATLMPLEGGPALGGAEVLLVRFAAGARFPRHAHRGKERVLVLEGGYRDDEGHVFEAGDIDEHEEGTSHAFEVLPDEPCVTVTVLEGGIDFESWPLRGLMKLLGR